jgi:GDP-L-fucose synthase
MDRYDGPDPINLGSGWELSIEELARLLLEVIGHTGELVFDKSRPDGMPLKVLDSSRLRSMGWQPKNGLRSGLEITYTWYLTHGRGSNGGVETHGAIPGLT